MVAWCASVALGVEFIDTGHRGCPGDQELQRHAEVIPGPISKIWAPRTASFDKEPKRKYSGRPG
jgi:hypothetical protein